MAPMEPRERIISFQEDLCVTAGAGAGKTTCLVDAYLGLLTGSAERPALTPDKIVAITFTEKAAAEMLSRVVQAIRAAGNPDLEALLPDLEWAPISTIHSFALSLLREFGPLLGMDPDFGVADEDQFSDMLGQIAQDWLRQGLAHADPTLSRLLAQYSLNPQWGLPAKLIRLYHQLATMGVTPEQAKQATEQAHAAEMAGSGQLVSELDGQIALLSQVVNQGLVNSTAQYGRTIADLLAAWPGLRSGLAEEPPSLDALEAIRPLHKGNWQKHANPIRQQIVSLVDQLAALRALPACRDLGRDLLAMLQGFTAQVDQEMKRRSLVSFDQILLGAMRLLLEHPVVLAELRRRYGALLVDEFQDVNPVQARLVNLLTGLDQPGPEGEPRPRLLLVGDRKQSIYAFRGAEVVLYSQVMNQFADQGGLVALAENFRSVPGLVDFYNRLFSQVFVPDDEQAADQRFVRFLPEDQQQPGGTQEPGNPQPVEVLDCRNLAEEGNKLKVAAWRALEAEALAGHLAALIGPDLGPGDIVLLFRRLTQVQVYEEAMGQAGLPYYTVRGSGFYACQEVRDMACALGVLVDPEDSVALLGLLRSPLVGLSDEALLALAWPQPDTQRPLSQALLSRAELPAWLGDDQQERWAKALDMVRELMPLARRMKPAELIERVLARSDLSAVHLGGPGGEQRLANLRKLLETAREPEFTRPGGMDGFVQSLRQMVDNPPQDPQAPLSGEKAQVIRLMSVHQAKGLQFPVVVLADLAGRPGGNPGEPPPGPGGMISPKALEALSGALLESPIHISLKNQAKAGEAAETARLFYVACTRARDRLIFCLNGNRSQGEWGKWVRDLVLDDPAVRAALAQTGQGQAGQAKEAPAAAWPGWLPAEPGPREEQGREIAERAMAPAWPPKAQVREAVTSLGNWFDCPRKYVFTRVLGLDTAEVMRLAGQGAGGSGSAVQLGSLVHSALENTDFAAGPPGLEAALEAAIGSDGFDPGLKTEASGILSHFWNTELAEYITQEPIPLILREQGFRLLLPSDASNPAMELIGQMDLALVWGDGRSLIVDYKVTDKLDINKYIYQLRLYALAMSKALPNAPELPRTAIFALSRQGAQLVEDRYGPEDLVYWEDQVRTAAREIAALQPRVLPGDLPAADPDQCADCVLAGLCDPDASRTVKS